MSIDVETLQGKVLKSFNTQPDPDALPKYQDTKLNPETRTRAKAPLTPT